VRICKELAAVFTTLLLTSAIAFADSTNPLPRIGEAPPFSLTTQDNAPLELTALRGKVIAVTFIFTTCKDTCPLLTAKLVAVQKQLPCDVRPEVAFLAISLTPEHDTPEVLKAYAQAYGADLSHWSFLTGGEEQIHALAKRYGVFVKARKAADDADHGFLTSIIDRAGILRVQYMGVRFEPNELLADLQALVTETFPP
jgi:protein SCO1